MLQRLSVLPTAGTAVAASAAETDLASVTLPTHRSGGRRVIRFEGVTRTTASTGLAVTLRLKYNGTTVFAKSSKAQSAGYVFVIEGSIVQRHDGTAIVRATITDSDSSGALTPVAYASIVSATYPTEPVVALTAQWAAATVGNSIQAESFVVRDEVRDWS